MGEAGIADTVHTVNFYFDYWIDTTEVTQSEYESVMKAAFPGYRRPEWNNGTGPDYPVYNITWYDAVLYCNERTKISGSNDTVYTYSSVTGTPGDTGFQIGGMLGLFMRTGFRLPTEAEWEYACRGGTSTRYFWGDDTLRATDYSWFHGNADQFHPIAQKAPNPLGLYDMIGNAFEFCNDYYGIYIQGATSDPLSPGPYTEANMVTCRGGSWQSNVQELGSANRGKVLIYERKMVNGFRVCRSFK
jgi:formylglycine-generating enzyme required for sulfatase activity